MPRPNNRPDLLAAADHEFERLWDAVAKVPEDARDRPGPCELWSVKDLLAHLNAWHQLALDWEAAGSRGETPEVPGHGFTWAETPALNQLLYERAADDSRDEIERRLRASHRKVLKVIESYKDEDLFTKQRYAWTGSTSVGSYFVSATSSHYAWASKLIRRWAKTLASD